MRTNRRSNQRDVWSWLAAAVCGVLLVALQDGALATERVTLSLDGDWQIAKNSQAEPPSHYESVAPVPGLADMAEPAFEGVG
jgi:hypothetical protein